MTTVFMYNEMYSHGLRVAFRYAVRLLEVEDVAHAAYLLPGLVRNHNLTRVIALQPPIRCGIDMEAQTDTNISSYLIATFV
jgi:hypothetical protein